MGNRTLKFKILVVLAAIVLTPVFAYGADSIIYLNKIHPGVRVGQQYLGGMNKNDAEKLLRKYSSKNRNDNVSLTWGEQSWKTSPKQLGAGINAKKTVEKAMLIGRSRGFALNFKDKLLVLILGKNAVPRVEYQQSKLNRFIKFLKQQVELNTINPTVIIKDEKAVPVAGEEGRKLIVRDLVSKLPEVFYSDKKENLSLKVIPVKPEISFKNAQKAAVQANIMISAPVSMVYSNNKWLLEKQKLISFLIFSEEKLSKSRVLKAKFDKSRVQNFISTSTKGIEKEPKDAKFAVSGSKAWVVAGQDGLKIDADLAAADIEAAANNSESDSRIAQLKSTIVKPELTTEKANTMGIKERISFYTTTYGSGARARVSNIHTLTKSLDGTLVAPGAVFSFNKTIGPRTAAKGYKEAPIIQNGKLVPGLGGGVCQVGTTTFNAIFFGGLPVLQRTNHSFYISHYPKGRDATVSYPYPDLSFKNDTGHYILIKGFYTSGSVTIALYGTDPGRDVSFTTSPFSNFRPFPTERIPDINIDQGIEKVEDKGQQGMQVTVVRIVKKDGDILFKDNFVSRYKPKIQVVRYGTRPVIAKPSPTAGYSATTSANQ